MFQDYILKILVFLIPTQLGLHFWPQFSRIGGIKIDYFSPTIYLTDLFLLVLIFLNLKFLSTKIFTLVQKNKWFVFLFFLNLTFSASFSNTFFHYLRIIGYLCFYLVLSDVPMLWKKIKNPFLLSLSLIVFLQFSQFLAQKSLNGLFYYFGERFFNSSSLNLPEISLFSRSYIRTPSTFSHPNSLSGYLIVCLLILQRFARGNKIKIVVFASTLLTFSKAALLALLLIVIRPFKNKRLLFPLFLLLSLSQLLFVGLHTNIFSFDSRLNMLRQYLQVFLQNPVLGCGFGNYPLCLSTTFSGSMFTHFNLQPVHNLPLLLLAELGVPLFLFVLYKIYLRLNSKNINLVYIVLFLGLFDHYWITSPQNLLILALSLALFRIEYPYGKAGNDSNKY